MITGKNGINLIKDFESLHDGDLKLIGLQPKMDPIGIWTEGYGRAMRDKKGNFIRGLENRSLAYANITINNEVEASTALLEDLKVYEAIVGQKIRIELSQNQFDALISYTYNTGGSDNLYKLINTRASNKDIRDWFETHYVTGSGKRLPGLVRRRKAEADLYFMP